MVIAYRLGMTRNTLSQPIVLVGLPGMSRTYTPRPDGMVDQITRKDDLEKACVVTTEQAVEAVERITRKGWQVTVSGPELTRLRRSARSRAARAARRDVLDSLGMTAVRGSVSGRTYYE